MYYVLITYVIPYIPYFKLQVHFSLSPTLTNSILPALITFAFRSFLSYIYTYLHSWLIYYYFFLSDSILR